MSLSSPSLTKHNVSLSLSLSPSFTSFNSPRLARALHASNVPSSASPFSPFGHKPPPFSVLYHASSNIYRNLLLLDSPTTTNERIGTDLSMDGMQGDGMSDDRRKGRSAARRAIPPVESAAEEVAAPPNGAPCGACKFLRRKCTKGCIFAPYFGSDQGAAKFAAVHKVFGASNVSKLLLHIPVDRRQDAVVTVSHEAQARLADPVYGCVSTILALQQQVATLQAELSLVHTQLMSSRYAVANAFQTPEMQQPQPPRPYLLPMLQPEYSNNSSATSNNFINIGSFAGASNFDIGAAASSHTLEPLPQFPHPPRDEDEGEGEGGEEEGEEESHVPAIFGDEIFRGR
ncbi:LOW QUALITY PROTEIN: LOB domain-containing protein 20 [Rhodamnia argentea]|uniref:LOW QUALITY PROTEIN: LOB domain-containing protein 20 n=1 Tax=Rhodamnia argentea TaxID=178133 RepID=A0A8B8NU58_9MYRT|nr:LOW QUALITY PROTEIN: LOB domain-containing protein 20 [Rhodamnia argentea]